MLKYLTKKFIAVFFIWLFLSMLSKLLLNYLFEEYTPLVATIKESAILAFFFSFTVQLIYLFRFRKMGIQPYSERVFDAMQRRTLETSESISEIRHKMENLFSKKASIATNETFSIDLIGLVAWSRLSVRKLSKGKGLNSIEIVVRPATALNILDFAENQFIMKKICETLGVNAVANPRKKDNKGIH